MTVDEFLLWAEGRNGRWELHDGVPVQTHGRAPTAMAPERAAHVRTKFRAATALQGALAPIDRTCEVFSDGLAVRIDAQTTFEPDAMVVCGLPAPDDALAIDNPVVVVEVLSPSTAAIDHGQKLSGYFSLASVEHYLILDPERRVVIHHKRGHGDAIETRVPSAGVIMLDPPGVEVPVEALFPPLESWLRSISGAFEARLRARRIRETASTPLVVGNVDRTQAHDVRRVPHLG